MSDFDRFLNGIFIGQMIIILGYVAWNLIGIIALGISIIFERPKPFEIGHVHAGVTYFGRKDRP